MWVKVSLSFFFFFFFSVGKRSGECVRHSQASLVQQSAGSTYLHAESCIFQGNVSRKHAQREFLKGRGRVSFFYVPLHQGIKQVVSMRVSMRGGEPRRPEPEDKKHRRNIR